MKFWEKTGTTQNKDHRFLYEEAREAYKVKNGVEVPFTSPGQSCSFDEFSVEYHCVWQGIPEEITEDNIEELKT